MTRRDDLVSDEPKPCPFCGSRAVTVMSNGFGRVYYECLNCEARGPWRWLREPEIASWNTRALIAQEDAAQDRGMEG